MGRLNPAVTTLLWVRHCTTASVTDHRLTLYVAGRAILWRPFTHHKTSVAQNQTYNATASSIVPRVCMLYVLKYPEIITRSLLIGVL